MHKAKVSQVNHSVTYILCSIIIGIYFQLNGVNYTNNSEVNITNIGSTDEQSLLCITDNPNCCGNPMNRMGEWYFPDMSTVRTEGEGDSFFRSRGPSVVRLYRRYNVMMPTGDFYCEVPDARGVNQRTYITIVAGSYNSSILDKTLHEYLIMPTEEETTTSMSLTTSDGDSRSPIADTTTASTTTAGKTMASTTMADTGTAGTTTATENDGISTASTATTKADTTTMPDSPTTNPPTARSTGLMQMCHDI